MNRVNYPVLPVEVQEIIKKWKSGQCNYSFEMRACFPARSCYPNPCIVFIIEVSGFSKDSEMKCPIKLHYEYTFALDENTLKENSKDVASDLKIKLENFTEEAYESFNKTLEEASKEGVIYTSDPLYY